MTHPSEAAEALKALSRLEEMLEDMPHGLLPDEKEDVRMIRALLSRADGGEQQPAPLDVEELCTKAWPGHYNYQHTAHQAIRTAVNILYDRGIILGKAQPKNEQALGKRPHHDDYKNLLRQPGAVSPEDFAKFQAALDRPAEVKPALKELMNGQTAQAVDVGEVEEKLQQICQAVSNGGSRDVRTMRITVRRLCNEVADLMPKTTA